MAHTSPTVLRRRIARELRQLRERADLSLDQARAHIDVSKSTMSRIERAETSIVAANVEKLLRLYGVQDRDVESLVELAKLARKRGWWQRFSDVLPDWFDTYVGLEVEASHISEYEPQLVPGILQVEEYTRALVLAEHPNDTGEQVDKRVQLRMNRQRRETPPAMWLILDEAALVRPVGSAKVMRRQLERVLEATWEPHNDIQVLPFNAGEHASMGSTFTILRFPDPRDTPVVYLENQVGGLYLEDEKEITRYTELFEHLKVSAADIRNSRDILSNAIACL